MKSLLRRIWQGDEGALTFEWILLITLVVIGILGGVSAVRDALITELGDVTGAAMNINQSYTVIAGPCGGTEFSFIDTPPVACPESGVRPAAPPITQGPVQSCTP